ncbi:phage tail tape measure protein [Cryobacterium sp. Hh11]|uniref:phage tail tape measure protein n=1 Tax=Cryobacterium sp. Hh11 TaxID=2555868 RepID=UPI00106C627D|nr:phage tail tape measure protein [Cryobacterium sp. Hh11]TFD51954.1 phage tail tape measure protein [Cryobacterium sp. Hh11]
MTAQVSGYLASMEKARKATSDAGTAAEKAARQVEEQKQAMESAGRGLMAVGVVAVAATALSVKAAIGWQSAWAGVTKTVEGTPAELAKVEEGLRSLAKTLPSSHDEIAAVAEAAGQLGIQTGSVVAFTNTMIDLGETTNLSADEAATSLARFMNVMGTSQDDVGRLGSAIVELGNNYATTEAEIVGMSMRLAGAGGQIGLSEGQVLGLATALSSVGIRAEAGGSAFSKVMIDIAANVESGGEKLELFAKTSGLSAQDFSDQWRSDPSAALALFVSGLGDAEAQGGSTLGILADLGVVEVEMRDALLRSAAASGDFTKAMQTGDDAFEENNALAEEAAKRYETVEAKLQIMVNRVSDAAISFGQVFLPAVSAASEGIGEMADFLGALDPKMQGAIATVGLLGGAVALAGGTFLLALPRIAAFQVSLGILATSSMPAVAASAARMMAATTRATTAMAAGAKFLTGPWGLAIAASAVGVGVLVTYLDSLKDSASEVENSMKTAKTAADIFQSVGEGRNWIYASDVTGQLKNLPNLLQEAANQSSNLWDKVSGREYHGAIIALKDIGKELAKTAAVDLPEAQRQFGLLADETDGSEKALGQLLDSMPAYKDALVAQASAQDINVNSTDEAANKTKLLRLAQEQAVPVTLSAADAYLETADKAASLDDEIVTLMDSMNELNGVGQDASSANIAYQQSIADVDEQIRLIDEGTKGYAKTLDIGTEAGRTNRGMLDQLAASNQTAAQTQFDLDGNTANYKATLEAGHQAVVDRAIALGANADEANRIADEISKIPDATAWTMVVNTAEATRKLQAFLALYNSTPAEFRAGPGTTRQPGFENLYRATGGTVYGPGTGTSDSIPVMLSNGEEVTRASMAEKYRPLLKAINADRVPGYAYGGTVGYATAPQYVTQGGGGGGGPAAPSQTIQNIQITAPAIETQDSSTYATILGREFGRQMAG